MLTSRGKDVALVARLRRGDEGAFRSLIDCYYGSLLRLALALVGERGLTRALVQETWSDVLHRLDTFNGSRSLKTWMFQILADRAKAKAPAEDPSLAILSPNLYAHGSGSEPTLDPWRFSSAGTWSDPPKPWGREKLSKSFARRETVDLVEQVIAGLPLRQRVVLTLRDIEGLEPREVCNILEVSETDQQVLLHRAWLKLWLTLEGYIAEDFARLDQGIPQAEPGSA